MNGGGTKEQLYNAFKKLGDLDKNTLVYCGHEYTDANFAYASTVEPNNQTLNSKKAWVSRLGSCLSC